MEACKNAKLGQYNHFVMKKGIKKPATTTKQKQNKRPFLSYYILYKNNHFQQKNHLGLVTHHGSNKVPVKGKGPYSTNDILNLLYSIMILNTICLGLCIRPTKTPLFMYHIWGLNFYG